MRTLTLLTLALATTASAHDPTAADLSRPGALQEHVDRHGPVTLPKGTIRYDKTLRLSFTAGKTIRGAGRGVPQGGWNRGDVAEGTVLHYTGPDDEPAISLVAANSVRLQDFTVLAPEAACAIEFASRHRGWPSSGGVFDNLSLIVDRDEGVGFHAGRQSLDSNAADCSFRSVWFHGAYGFVCEHNQNVDYTFSDGCMWFNSRVCLWTKRGGNVFVFGCQSNGVREAILRIGAEGRGGGGVNCMPFVIHGFRHDRTGSNARALLVDAQHAGGLVRGSLDGINTITRSRDDDSHEGHEWIRWPERSNGDRDYLVVGATSLTDGAEQFEPLTVLRKSDGQPVAE